MATNITSRKEFKNKISVIVVIAAVLLVIMGLGQVLLRNIYGDRASANVGSNYLTAIGFNSADTTANGAFVDSRNICQASDDQCGEGLIDFDFASLAESTGIAKVADGGIILSKTETAFEQNGTLTSRAFNLRDTAADVRITKIRVGVGLKPDNYLSLAYSANGAASYQTVLGNYSYNQLQSQTNRTVVEHNFVEPVKVEGSFSYKVALKASTDRLTSPSLKYVRVYYTVASPSSSSSSAPVSSSSSSSIPPVSSSSQSSSSSVSRPNLPIPGGDSTGDRNPTR